MPDNDISHYVEDRLNALEVRVEALEGQQPVTNGEEVTPPVEGEEEVPVEESVY